MSKREVGATAAKRPKPPPAATAERGSSERATLLAQLFLKQLS